MSWALCWTSVSIDSFWNGSRGTQHEILDDQKICHHTNEVAMMSWHFFCGINLVTCIFCNKRFSCDVRNLDPMLQVRSLGTFRMCLAKKDVNNIMMTSVRKKWRKFLFLFYVSFNIIEWYVFGQIWCFWINYEINWYAALIWIIHWKNNYFLYIYWIEMIL